MPGRLTVRGTMAAVALIGLCLAAFRIHFSLGSFAFGVLSIAWIRTSAKIKRRETTESPVRPAMVVGIFLDSLASEAAILLMGIIPGLLLGNLMLFSRLSHGNVYDPSNWGLWLAISSACAVLIYRLIHLWSTPRPAPPSKGDPANRDEPMEPR